MNKAEYMESLLLEVDTILRGFTSIPLQELSAESQMSRFDNKYLFSSTLLPELLSNMKDQYDILEVNEHRILNYQSDYFDTEQFDMYLAHHNGKMNRYKIRFREYLESGHKFLEIKHKNNKRFTTKQRIPITNMELSNPVQFEFINKNSSYIATNLVPSLQTRYKRITFINKSQEKRITIDCSLNFSLKGENLATPGIAIAEIKNLDRNPSSRFNQILDSYGIKKCGFSKYAVGISLLDKNIKNNRFKEKLNLIHNLQHEFTRYFNSEHTKFRHIQS